MDNEQLAQTMKGLTTTELAEIADSDPDDYTEEARALAPRARRAP